ncbi:MAG: helix-hairpin-helix domain-containing protein [Saprospiraceae bacterium]
MKKSRKELEQRKEALAIAKQAKKQARKAYRAQLKALKAHLKPFKRALKQAELMEQETKNALKKALKKADKDAKESAPAPAMTSSKSKKSKTTKAPSKRGPGRPPKTAAAAQKKKPGRKPGRPRKTPAGGDDLTRINRLGEKVAAMFKKNGITTFAALAATPVERLRELLRKNNMSKFRNPTPWPEEAAKLAATPEAKTPAAPAKRRGRPPKAAATAEKKTSGRKPGRPRKAAAAPKKSPGRPRKTTTTTPKKTAGRPRKTSVGGDDLTLIKGLGDKVAAMLTKNGIKSFTTLAATPVERLRELLRKNNMSKFRNPTSWPEEAAKLAKK